MNRMSPAILGLGPSLTIVACGSTADTTSAPSASPQADSAFALPDLGLLTSKPGITLSPARCDEQGALAGGSTVVNGDGSGTYANTATDETIVVGRDGSGTYSDGKLTITGTALVVSQAGSRSVNAEPLPRVPDVGRFPSIDAAKPIESCGTVITLSDSVLFDFGSSEVRPEAEVTLTDLAQLLNGAGAPTVHVYGHTDSVSDDGFNQTLSEQRAQAVVASLIASGTTATPDAQGFGESRPVAHGRPPTQPPRRDLHPGVLTPT